MTERIVPVPLQFAVDSRTNSIIATGSAGDLNIIEALLLRLDEKDLQQRINTVFELKNSPALDVATAINEFLRSERQLVQATPGPVNPFSQIEREVIVVPEPVSNSLILSATPRFFDDIKKLIEDLDAQPPQVIIQVLIAEVQLSNANEFGVELGLQDSVLFDRSLLGDLVTLTQTITPQNLSQVTSQSIVGATNSPGFNFNNEALGNSGSTTALSRSNVTGSQGLSSFNLGRVSSDLGFGGLVFSASSESVSVLVRALEESRYSEVLARPQITTLDNQSAFIQVGQRVPRIVASTISQTGQVNSVDLENVGLILGVTPRISPDGMVVMEIDAERSQIDRIGPGIPVAISATGDAVESPAIDVQTAQTTVSAADGETIVLGGLITKNKRTIDRRVPYLADIPVLGNLFRFKSKQEQRNELLIILTPHVIRSAEDAERIKSLETSRMNWTSSDVHELYGDAGLCTRADCPLCEAKTEVIYPDFNPRAELPELLEKTEEVPEPNEGVPDFPGYFPNHESPEMIPPVSQSRMQRPDFPLTRNNRSTNESTPVASRPYLTNTAPPLPPSARGHIPNQNLQQHNPPSNSAMQQLANRPRVEGQGVPNRGAPNYSSPRYGAGVSSANYNRGKVIR